MLSLLGLGFNPCLSNWDPARYAVWPKRQNKQNTTKAHQNTITKGNLFWFSRMGTNVHKKARVPNTSTRPVSEVWFSLPNLSMVGKRIHSTCYPKIFEEQVLWVLSPYSKHLWESQGLRGFWEIHMQYANKTTHQSVLPSGWQVTYFLVLFFFNFQIFYPEFLM